MEITADTDGGNVILTIPAGFKNSSKEDLEIIINITRESDDDDYCEPDQVYYQPSVVDTAALSVANSFTSLIGIFCCLWVLGFVMSLFE